MKQNWYFCKMLKFLIDFVVFRSDLMKFVGNFMKFRRSENPDFGPSRQGRRARIPGFRTSSRTCRYGPLTYQAVMFSRCIRRYVNLSQNSFTLYSKVQLQICNVRRLFGSYQSFLVLWLILSEQTEIVEFWTPHFSQLQCIRPRFSVVPWHKNIYV